MTCVLETCVLLTASRNIFGYLVEIGGCSVDRLEMSRGLPSRDIVFYSVFVINLNQNPYME